MLRLSSFRLLRVFLVDDVEVVVGSVVVVAVVLVVVVEVVVFALDVVVAVVVSLFVFLCLVRWVVCVGGCSF